VSAKKYEASIEPDPCPDLVVERGPSNKGVGSWVPTQKHRLLWEYLYATRNAWKKWPSHVFIDPFVGPGRIQVEGEKGTRDGGAVVAWRALSDTAPFSQMLVGDIDSHRAHACAERLRKIGAPVTQFVGPADETIREMVASVPPRTLCMAYIDPYNLELLSFSLIEALAKLKVDLAINFSTMDLQRNAELEFDPKRARFDGTAPGWRLDTKVLSASKQNVASAFFQYWCELVRALGFQHSKEMPLVHNDRGRAIYRMVFFARNKLPNRIWNDVARGPNRSFPFDAND
jgi:three-Cys-motif partner protein